MKKRQGIVFLSFLFISMLLGASAAYAGIRIQHLHYSLSPSGPFPGNHSLTVCEGGTFYIQVEVDEASGSNDWWRSSHLYYRFADSGPYTQFAGCDIEPNPNVDIPDNGSHTEVFQVTAPMQAGGMDIRVEAYQSDGCDSLGDTESDTPDPITVVAAPDATITSGDDSVCAGATGLTASVPSAGAEATYAWEVTGGTIDGGQGTTQITWDADQGAGTATVSVEVTNAGGCTAEDTDDVTVNALPVCDIASDRLVCAGEADLEASVASAGEGATYTWGITNGTITGGEGTDQITWTAGAVSPVTLTIEITDSNGCTCSDSFEVTVNPLPLGCTITAPATVEFGSTGNTASIAEGPTPGATYAWVIYVDGVLNNGLITAGQNTSQITWRAPVSFTQIDIGVTVTTDLGCVCENDPPVGGGTGGVVVTGTGQAGSIPTLSEWGMIILGVLMAGTAVIAMRRKNDMTV